MSDAAPDEGRWTAWLFEVVDPLVRDLVTLADPWHAYDAAMTLVGVLSSDYLTESSQGGAVYVTWSEITDVFETGRTPDSDAHDLLRSAARRWLDRDDEPTAAFQERWVSETEAQTHALFRRDGHFWRNTGDR